MFLTPNLYVYSYSPQPRISLSETHVNLGTVMQSMATSKTISISNYGSDDLQIISVAGNTCCPIFDYSIDKKLLHPGENNTLTISFEDPGFHGSIKERAIIRMLI